MCTARIVRQVITNSNFDEDQPDITHQVHSTNVNGQAKAYSRAGGNGVIFGRSYVQIYLSRHKDIRW